MSAQPIRRQEYIEELKDSVVPYWALCIQGNTSGFSGWHESCRSRYNKKIEKEEQHACQAAYSLLMMSL